VYRLSLAQVQADAPRSMMFTGRMRLDDACPERMTVTGAFIGLYLLKRRPTLLSRRSFNSN